MDRIVQVQTFELLYVEADSFPDGIQYAWNTLEKKLGSLKGRKFYGASWMEGEKIRYIAGVIPVSSAEKEILRLPIIKIEGGTFITRKIEKWHERIDEIGRIFDMLAGLYPLRKGVPFLEYYRSNKELILMVPIGIENKSP